MTGIEKVYKHGGRQAYLDRIQGNKPNPKSGTKSNPFKGKSLVDAIKETQPKVETSIVEPLKIEMPEIKPPAEVVIEPKLSGWQKFKNTKFAKQ